MDPLHQTDSAISVASSFNKDEGSVRDAHPYGTPSASGRAPPPTRAQAASDDRHSQASVDADHDSTPASIDPRQEAVPSFVSQVQPPPASPAAGSGLVAPSSVDLASSHHTPQEEAHADHTPLLPRSPSPPPSPPTDTAHHLVASEPAVSSPAASPALAPADLSTHATGGDASGSGQFQDQNHEADPDALTQSGTGAIIIDHEQLELESDPGYESDRASFASTSLSSSVRDYLFENGRRYHRFREGRYNFPNDEAEQDREDMKHTCVKLLCQEQLFFAPIRDGSLHNILDIGTGTGIWALEMGDQFPSANVLGIDLSPIQPDWVPANVRFEVDDAESPWIHPLDHFDYIHTRHTVMAIKDWPKLYRTAKDHLRPGGWIESQEIYHYPISLNNSMPPDHPVAQYWALIHQGLNRLGIDFQAAAGGKIAAMMRDAGFVNVQERIFHVPLGTWPKHPELKVVGEYWRHILLVGAQAIALGPLTRGCGWTREEVEVFLIELRKAYYDNNCLMYMPMYVTYGQKPEH